MHRGSVSVPSDPKSPIISKLFLWQAVCFMAAKERTGVLVFAVEVLVSTSSDMLFLQLVDGLPTLPGPGFLQLL